MCLIKNNFDFINWKFLRKLTAKEEEEKVCGRRGDHFDDCWVRSAPCYTHWSSFIGTTCPPNSAHPSTHSSPCTHTRLPGLTKLFSSLTVTSTMRLLSFVAGQNYRESARQWHTAQTATVTRQHTHGKSIRTHEMCLMWCVLHKRIGNVTEKRFKTRLSTRFDTDNCCHIALFIRP